jgi:hypothetical protein
MPQTRPAGDAGGPDRRTDSMASSVQLPVTTLTVLGAIVAVLGLFAAGSIVVTAVGLAAIAFAGILAVAGSRRA